MFLYIGKDVIIKKSKIVAILDIDKKCLNFIRDFGEKNKIIDLSDDNKKSLIITNDKNDGNVGYISSISSITLSKRAQLNIL